jgi:hypothetical protein
MDARGLTAGVVLVWLFGPGCRPIDKCAESGTPCGGNPVGRWTLAGSCQDPTLPSNPVARRTYLGQPITTAGQQPPEPTSADWCADLAYEGPVKGITKLNLPRDTPPIIGGTLEYQDDHSYSAFITNAATTSIDFSASCLTRFGYFPTCGEFNAAFADLAQRQGGIKLPPTAGADAATPEFCADDGAGGCRCTYIIEGDATGANLTGTWSASGSVITHFPASMTLPSQVDFCVAGDSLTLWGHDRMNVLDVVGAPGARTLSLRR